MKYYLLMMLSILLFVGCRSQNKIEESKKYSQVDSLTEQLHTATKLKNYMENKEYDKAIALFSKEQQQNILQFRNDNDLFKYWCLAWTFDGIKFERYLSKIKNGKAHFIFEDNQWKIDER